MRNFIVLFFMFLIAYSVQANTPFHPYEETRFLAIEDGSSLVANKIHSKQFNIKPTATAYATGSTITLGTLPANAAIYKDYIYVQNQVTSAATDTTLALQCESANDLLSAMDIIETGYATGTVLNGARNFANTATSTMVYTGSDGCDVKAVIAGPHTGLIGGELELIVEYILY